MYYQLIMSHLFSITVLLEHPFIVLQHYTYSLILALFVADVYIDLKYMEYIEIPHLRAKSETAMVSCSRFIWITNCSDHRRV